MDFEEFAAARDCFYLAVILFGAGTGCILNRYRKISTRRFQNWSVTAGLIFFSGGLAVLTAALIYSSGKILLEISLYPYAVILSALIIAAFRYPREAGFPLILVSGAFVVWISYGYFRFPAINDESRLRVTREANGFVYVTPAALNVPEKPLHICTFQPAGNDLVLEFRAFCFSFSKAFPVIGGMTRADIAEIRSRKTLYYSDSRFISKLFPGLYLSADAKFSANPFFSVHEISARLEPERLKLGRGLTVFLDEKNIVFRD